MMRLNSPSTKVLSWQCSMTIGCAKNRADVDNTFVSVAETPESNMYQSIANTIGQLHRLATSGLIEANSGDNEDKAWFRSKFTIDANASNPESVISRIVSLVTLIERKVHPEFAYLSERRPSSRCRMARQSGPHSCLEATCKRQGDGAPSQS
jgi:hypothetical protein